MKVQIPNHMCEKFYWIISSFFTELFPTMTYSGIVFTEFEIDVKTDEEEGRVLELVYQLEGSSL